jgi:hypothetical protein
LTGNVINEIVNGLFTPPAVRLADASPVSGRAGHPGGGSVHDPEYKPRDRF